MSSRRTAIPAELLEAYAQTEFHVFSDPPLVLRIGARNNAMQDLFARTGSSSAAFVTAWNPYSEPRTEAENIRAQDQLMREVHDAGYSHVPGEGRDPSGLWPGEASLLISGISRPEAEALGQRYGQNAIVWVGSELVPELVLLR
ncbi:MAG: DUF3293 domain-containing protein [Rhodospirillales bacterium]